jgi:hypothetical protein
MSHLRVKTTFHVQGTYGSTDKKTLYCHLNKSCDITTFYDEDGTYLFSFEDTEDNNLFEAMKRLASPQKEARSSDLEEGIEHMNEEDQRKCGIW